MSSGSEEEDLILHAAPARESGQQLLERALALAEHGNGSAVLRRHCQTLRRLREEKHAAIAAASSFKITHARIMKQHSALRLAKKRAIERQQNAKLAIVAHMRYGGLD